jgi:protein-arginine kinase activator protein McsA
MDNILFFKEKLMKCRVCDRRAVFYKQTSGVNRYWCAECYLKILLAEEKKADENLEYLCGQ